jgi:NADPH-dependent F420 reductase
MKIGVLGSGNVGQSLGKGFASRGHDVKIGSREPKRADLQKWLKETKGKVSTGTLAETAKHGEVLVLCTVGNAAEHVLELAGANHFDDKVLIDVTVPLDFSKGMPPGLFVGTTDSLGERIQRKLPKTRVVKSFNMVNNQTMINPKMQEGTPDMIICGDDAMAKQTVAGLLRELGWGEPIDIGGIEGARWLEAWVPLWVGIATKLGTWGVALKILRS